MRYRSRYRLAVFAIFFLAVPAFAADGLTLTRIEVGGQAVQDVEL